MMIARRSENLMVREGGSQREAGLASTVEGLRCRGCLTHLPLPIAFPSTREGFEELPPEITRTCGSQVVALEVEKMDRSTGFPCYVPI
jgi:hypothetical protein